MNYWIGAAYDSHTYKEVIDSLRNSAKKMEIIEANDSIIKAESKITIEAKDQTIAAGDKLAEEYKGLYIEADKGRKFWRIVSEALAAVTAGLITYELIK